MMGAAPGKRALVTGASSGVGNRIVMRLLGDGWSVIGFSRGAPDLDHPGFHHRPVDLADPDATAAAVSLIGPVDALVHAAGLLRVGLHDQMDRGEAALMWRLHVDAAAQLMGAMLPQMPDGGRVVLIGSRVAGGAAGRSAYAASKSALTGLARSVAAEVVARGITVNVIAPGATDTPMLHDPARAGQAPKLPPMGRFVNPDEIAALASFLLSPGAASITGQQIVVCAGGSL